MDQTSQLKSFSSFLSKMFLQMRCDADSARGQAKCWGPAMPGGCRGVKGDKTHLDGIKLSKKERERLYQLWGEDDAYEPVGFSQTCTRSRVEDLLEIEISNGRGDEDLVRKKLYNEDDNVSIVSEMKDSVEENKDEVKEISEASQFMMYKTYLDKYK